MNFLTGGLWYAAWAAATYDKPLWISLLGAGLSYGALFCAIQEAKRK